MDIPWMLTIQSRMQISDMLTSDQAQTQDYHGDMVMRICLQNKLHVPWLCTTIMMITQLDNFAAVSLPCLHHVHGLQRCQCFKAESVTGRSGFTMITTGCNHGNIWTNYQPDTWQIGHACWSCTWCRGVSLIIMLDFKSHFGEKLHLKLLYYRCVEIQRFFVLGTN